MVCRRRVSPFQCCEKVYSKCRGRLTLPKCVWTRLAFISTHTVCRGRLVEFCTKCVDENCPSHIEKLFVFLNSSRRYCKVGHWSPIPVWSCPQPGVSAPYTSKHPSNFLPLRMDKNTESKQTSMKGWSQSKWWAFFGSEPTIEKHPVIDRVGEQGKVTESEWRKRPDEPHPKLPKSQSSGQSDSTKRHSAQQREEKKHKSSSRMNWRKINLRNFQSFDCIQATHWTKKAFRNIKCVIQTLGVTRLTLSRLRQPVAWKMIVSQNNSHCFHEMFFGKCLGQPLFNRVCPPFQNPQYRWCLRFGNSRFWTDLAPAVWIHSRRVGLSPPYCRVQAHVKSNEKKKRVSTRVGCQAAKVRLFPSPSTSEKEKSCKRKANKSCVWVFFSSFLLPFLSFLLSPWPSYVGTSESSELVHHLFASPWSETKKEKLTKSWVSVFSFSAPSFVYPSLGDLLIRTQNVHTIDWAVSKHTHTGLNRGTRYSRLRLFNVNWKDRRRKKTQNQSLTWRTSFVRVQINQTRLNITQRLTERKSVKTKFEWRHIHPPIHTHTHTDQWTFFIRRFFQKSCNSSVAIIYIGQSSYSREELIASIHVDHEMSQIQIYVGERMSSKAFLYFSRKISSLLRMWACCWSMAEGILCGGEGSF